MFWGDRPDQRARRSLATALWQIRRCFPDKSFIQADVHTVQFTFPGPLQLDVETFESAVSLTDVQSLHMAVLLYRGDFLDDFFDEWVIDERYRLQSHFLGALTRLMRLHETTGAYEATLETAARLLTNDPLREEAHRVVMRAYSFLGQRNSALKQYANCRKIIAEELGVEPMPETRQLYHDIRDNKLAVPASFATTPIPFPVTQPEGHSFSGHHPLEAAAAPPLVGRDNELGLLDAHWQHALTRESGLLIILGEAGVGKTRLAESFAKKLHRQGYRVLWGRCYEFERVLPYQPLIEALRSLLPHLSPTELSAIPDWCLAEVARLLPELLELRPELDSPTLSGLEGQQSSLFTALARVLTGLASLVPFLIVVEDLQWAGESTLQLLHFLARQLQGQPILILGTARPVSPVSHRPFGPFQASLSQEGLAIMLNLSRLTERDVNTLVAEMSGSGDDIAPFAHRLFQETEGNPFFLVEICKTLFENNIIDMEAGIWQGDFERISVDVLPLPASITHAIRIRVHRLAKETQNMLGVSAVLGREFDFEALNAIWDKGEEETLEELDHLLRARLIIEGSGDQGRDFAFAHHKIQEVVYADLPRRLRQHLHGQAGQALQTMYAGQEDVVAVELAHHFEQGQRVNKRLLKQAIHYLQLAGKQAASQFANADAEQYLSR
ncbi:MAG TPA: AAA family ATPase, partial [candidate division Zixibacteria bacterium]|nr:AAA family ATPase [candidate division Zixibacteria bacterium]